MKNNISVTIDKEVLRRLDKYAYSVARSRSQVIEVIIKYFLDASDRKEVSNVNSTTN